MQELVRQAMREGALGFSTSQLEHPRRRGRARGAVATTPTATRSCALGVRAGGVRARRDRDHPAQLRRRLRRRRSRAAPRHVSRLRPADRAERPRCRRRRTRWAGSTRSTFVHEAFARRRPPPSAVHDQRLGLHLKLADTFVFDEMPDVARGADRCRSPSARAAARPGAARAPRRGVGRARTRSPRSPWDVLEVEAVRDARACRVGRAERRRARRRARLPARSTRSSTARSPRTSRRSGRRGSPTMAHAFIAPRACARGSPIRSSMAGSSDGGAHLASFVGADYTTRLLTEWVPDPLTFEQAVWRLTGMPATVHGLADRGFVREGAWADLLLIDRGRLRAGQRAPGARLPGRHRALRRRRRGLRRDGRERRGAARERAPHRRPPRPRAARRLNLAPAHWQRHANRPSGSTPQLVPVGQEPPHAGAPTLRHGVEPAGMHPHVNDSVVSST